jgi:hypothetical protein
MIEEDKPLCSNDQGSVYDGTSPQVRQRAWIKIHAFCLSGYLTSSSARARAGVNFPDTTCGCFDDQQAILNISLFRSRNRDLSGNTRTFLFEENGFFAGGDGLYEPGHCQILT